MSALALPPSSQAEPESAPQEGTQAAWGQTKSGNKWSKTGLTVAVALFVVAALGVAVLQWRKAPGASPSESATAAGQAATVNAQVAATVQSAASVASRETISKPLEVSMLPGRVLDAGASVVASPIAAQSATKTKSPNTSGQGRSGVAPATSPAIPSGTPSTGARTTKPNCDPNYTLDAEGHRHFKPECF